MQFQISKENKLLLGNIQVSKGIIEYMEKMTNKTNEEVGFPWQNYYRRYPNENLVTKQVWIH